MPSPTIVLDASAGNIMQPLPDGQRSFASSADLATFLQENLNAIPVYDGAGNVIGTYANVLKIGTTYYLDANNNVQPATEPISAFIGGLGAQFTVAGVAYSTGVQGQDVAGPQATASAPSDVFQCNQFGECISGHSWNTHTFGHFYNNVGIEVDQETGGYQESHSFCWKGPCPFCIPWICTNSSGTNQLHLDGELWNPGAFSGEPFNQTSSNVTHIEYNAWSICFTAEPCGDAGNLVGACEEHWSAAIPSIGRTTAGTTGQCPGPLGVTCSAGYALCQPNNTCTSLASDVRNCGACGNACPAGYSCQSSACVAPPPPPPPPPPTCRPGQRSCGDGTCVPSGAQCP